MPAYHAMTLKVNMLATAVNIGNLVNQDILRKILRWASMILESILLPKSLEAKHTTTWSIFTQLES
jgi:hypothetical protein